jgi:Tfp pilus assembly protein PilV
MFVMIFVNTEKNMNKNLIICLLILAVIILAILSVFKTCNNQVDQVQSQNKIDSLKVVYDGLKYKHDSVIKWSQTATSKYEDTISTLKNAQQKSNILHSKRIAEIRKLSNDSAHVILKQSYTPTEALTKITQLDSCEADGVYLYDLMDTYKDLSDLKTETIISQVGIIDSLLVLSDTCLIMNEGLSEGINESKKKNESLKKWCKGFAIVSISSILLNVLLIGL